MLRQREEGLPLHTTTTHLMPPRPYLMLCDAATKAGFTRGRAGRFPCLHLLLTRCLPLGLPPLRHLLRRGCYSSRSVTLRSDSTATIPFLPYTAVCTLPLVTSALLQHTDFLHRTSHIAAGLACSSVTRLLAPALAAVWVATVLQHTPFLSCAHRLPFLAWATYAQRYHHHPSFAARSLPAAA